MDSNRILLDTVDTFGSGFTSGKCLAIMSMEKNLKLLEIIITSIRFEPFDRQSELTGTEIGGFSRQMQSFDV